MRKLIFVPCNEITFRFIQGVEYCAANGKFVLHVQKNAAIANYFGLLKIPLDIQTAGETSKNFAFCARNIGKLVNVVDFTIKIIVESCDNRKITTLGAER